MLCSPEERKKRFETVASSDDTNEKENRLSSSLNQPTITLPSEVSPFINDPEFIYEDFAKRGQVSEMHTFRIQVCPLFCVYTFYTTPSAH